MFEFLKRPTDTYTQYDTQPREQHIEVHDNDIPHGEDV